MLIRLPGAALRPFVECYWLSRDNTDREFRLLPDARIDLVVEAAGSGWVARGYGTATRPTTLACTPGSHYLGIRFRPGMARHFLRASAQELTDRQADAASLAGFPLEPLAERLLGDDVFAELDRRLLDVLQRAAPAANAVDHMVRRIEAAQGAVRLACVFDEVGMSPRWAQRQFLQHVGLTPKFFARITRTRHAAQLMSSGAAGSLADLAAQAGYADQSHMTRECVRLTGRTPAQWRTAFVQDTEAHATPH